MSVRLFIRNAFPLLLALALACAGASSPEAGSDPTTSMPPVERTPQPAPASEPRGDGPVAGSEDSLARLHSLDLARAEHRARAALRRAALEEALLRQKIEQQLAARARRSTASGPADSDLEALREAGARRLEAARELTRAEQALSEARL